MALAAACSSAYSRTVLARVRSDAPHHPGHRRRSGSTCPPDVAHVLRLQRTIGNRATTRLLQRGALQVRGRHDHVAGRRQDARQHPEGDRGEQGPAALPQGQVPARRGDRGHVRGPSRRGGLQPGLHQLPAHRRRPADREGARRGVRPCRRLLRPLQERDPRALAQQLRPRAPRGAAQAREPGLPRPLGRHHQRRRDAVLHGLRAAGAGPRRGQGPQVRGPSRVRAQAAWRRRTATPSRGSSSSATARCARR